MKKSKYHHFFIEWLSVVSGVEPKNSADEELLIETCCEVLGKTIEELEQEIDEGVKNGYSAEVQFDLMKAAFSKMVKAG